MMDQSATMDGPPIMKCLIEGIKHKACMGSSAARQPTMWRAKASITKAT